MNGETNKRYMKRKLRAAKIAAASSLDKKDWRGYIAASLETMKNRT